MYHAVDTEHVAYWRSPNFGQNGIFIAAILRFSTSSSLRKVKLTGNWYMCHLYP